MYVPALYKQSDISEALRLIRGYPFATLGQNRNEEDFRGALEALGRSNDDMSRGVRDLMERTRK